ncbi:aspartate aminotransferase family protein [Nisaea acidiphila]|uniref:Aspartate aminotransferase family protein n=1 Tax=Nisaea acidiphila TaxID=1862145 RepID=A0A9J7ANH8_9PROT|nr:aspartate aminotransferase family protein [Nisaea acidiphila]UUX48743.1 aspartate aminotransferase family protein [Nisaea acidiphila]
MTFQPNSPAARDVAYVLHPYTNFVAHEEKGPLIIDRGEGVYVYDDAGKKYIEGMAGLWSTSLGFHNDRLKQAAMKQFDILPYYHTFAHRSHLPGIDLAEKLISVAPVPMSKVFFNNSGSEANDTAIKIVWYYNNALGRHHKKKIIGRVNGYHGITLASASLTGRSMNHRGFDAPIANFIHAEEPNHYNNALEGESEEDYATRLAENLEKMIVEEGPDTVAAFWAEPVMGAGGVIVPPKTYFDKVQKVLQKYDILFVADEVICGFGRTGNYWGSQTFDMKPDILVCAKALSSSYLPISATLINEKVYEPVKNASAELGAFGHGYTYSGHPVCAAVALETLKIYDEENIIEKARDMAPVFQKQLRSFSDHPLVGEARGVGLMGAIQVMQDKASKKPFEASAGVGPMIANLATEEGVMLRAVGDSLAFCPPLIISESEIEEMFACFRRGLDRALDHLRKEGQAVA